MKNITLSIELLLFLLACTTSKDISTDSEIIDSWIIDDTVCDSTANYD